MSFIKFLDSLSDPELLNKKASRRDSFQRFGNAGKGLALASIPFGLAATSSKTKAATMAMASAAFQASPNDVLNFALTLEYLERNFYLMALDTNGLIPEEDRDVFGLIAAHEESHVEFLRSALGEAAIDEPTFDFTGAPGGLSLDTFSNYDTFLALAQGFEDTGVRAYKGQAGALIDNDDLLEFALQIHSVEARHASEIRRLRASFNGDPLNEDALGWITLNNRGPGMPEATQPVYDGEENVVQAGINLVDATGFGAVAVSQSYDEPISGDTAVAIASLFIAP